ncbi:MAG: helix-turn-helix domain-containing protein [Mycobacterium sp.]
MANERLAAAMQQANVTVRELATVTERDPKTVSRWLGGRVPHPRQRYIVAKALNDEEEFLWPGAGRKIERLASATSEIVATYPYRSNMPRSEWWRLITSAERQIDLLGYTLYFLALEHPELVPVLKRKCQAGCKVRAVVADPNCQHVRNRDNEEDEPITLAARIHTTLKYFNSLYDVNGFELRHQDAPLYNSVFRFDDQMLVTPHLYATPGSSAPMIHLKRLASNGLFCRFATHLEAIWSITTAVPTSDATAT